MSLAISRILISFYKYGKLPLLENYSCQSDITLTMDNVVTEEQPVLLEFQKLLSLAHSYSVCAGQKSKIAVLALCKWLVQNIIDLLFFKYFLQLVKEDLFIEKYIVC